MTYKPFSRRALWLTAFSLIAALSVSGCRKYEHVLVLGSCWNVNDLQSMNVRGAGVFLTSTEGLSLQSLGCSDRRGRNRFELSKEADHTLRSFLLSDKIRSRALSMKFEGAIDKTWGGNVLYIEHLSDVRGSAEPKWIDDLRKKLEHRSAR
jgi:hypothetical protein